MLCERKFKPRKTDQRQIGIETNPTITRRCNTEMDAIGMFGFSCSGCNRTLYLCQACNELTDNIKRHFLDKDTGKWNACYRHVLNQPFRQLMASMKRP